MIHEDTIHYDCQDAACRAANSRTGLEGREFGRVFGEVMKRHPTVDAILVNDILRIVHGSLTAR